MERLRELRMTLILLLVGVFFLSGCFFSSKKEITFKTNGGSIVKNITVKKGNKISEPEKPTKAGYEFVGWYLDGEEYDFDKEISEDITLIAKWAKVDDVDIGLDLGTTEPTMEPTTEESTTTTTSKTQSKTSSVVKTTLQQIKATTTKKTTTTTKKVNDTNNNNTGNTPVKPVDPVIPTPPTPVLPIEPVEPKKEFKMNISSIDVPDQLGVATGKKEVTIDFASATPNVISLIGEEELQEVLKSDYKDWIIHNEYAILYNTDCVGERIAFLSDTEIKTLSIIIGEKRYIIEYQETSKMWEIKYPTVRVIDGINTYYYNSLKQAIEASHRGAIVSLLNDIELTEEIKITNAITIDGNEHLLKMAGVPFTIEVSDVIDESITIKNVKMEADTFIHITNKTKIKKIILENISGTYKTSFVKNDGSIEIEEMNNTVTKEEDDSEDKKEDVKEEVPAEKEEESSKEDSSETSNDKTEEATEKE